MAYYAEKEKDTSWWDKAPMPPTGTRIKELIVDFIDQLDKINDNDDSTGLILPALVNEHMDDLFWFCETIASGCVSGGWKPFSSQEKKRQFSQAVGVSDLAFAIMVLEKHSDKWQKQGKTGRVNGEILDDCIAYYQEVADELEKLFMGDGDQKNKAGMTLKVRISQFDGWLINKAELHHQRGNYAYFDSTDKTKQTGGTRNDGGNRGENGEQNKKKYVVNHGIKYNPHVADMIVEEV